MGTARQRPGNVAAHLSRFAQERPDALAVAVADGAGFTRLTAAELDRLSDRAAWALTAVGIHAGTRTVLMVTPSPEFFALTFALFKIGAVPVMVDPGMGRKNLGECLAEAKPGAFVGIPKAQLARKLFGWGRRTVRTAVTVGWFPGTHRFGGLLRRAKSEPFPTIEPEPGQSAAVLFTSGSTGTPKGVVYTHETFAAQIDSLRTVYGIEPGEIDLSTFPLFALFGPALGMASIVPRMDASRPATADPRDLMRALAEFQCTNVFANPALVDLLGRHCAATGTKFPASVRRVLSAGAPARPDALERLSAALPEVAEIHTPYGATEALPIASIGSMEILGETRAATDAGRGVCVGAPVPGVEVAIIPIDDDVVTKLALLAAGEIGEIAVRGPMVTREYFHRERATELAKIRDGDTLWHRMGDVGYLDDRGRLWMCGRMSQRVVTADTTLFTIPCEAVFNTHPNVRRTALVGLGEGERRRPILCVELAAGLHPSEALTQELLDLGRAHPHTASIDTVFYHNEFPMDVRHNAKIFREKLGVWAAWELHKR